MRIPNVVAVAATLPLIPLDAMAQAPIPEVETLALSALAAAALGLVVALTRRRR